MPANTDPAAVQAAVLESLRIVHSAIARAVNAGQMTLVRTPASDQRITASVGDVYYRLEERQPGVLKAFIDEEPEKLRKELEAMESLVTMVKRAESLGPALQQALNENETLRALCSPLEVSILQARRDPATNELVSTRSLKRVVQ